MEELLGRKVTAKTIAAFNFSGSDQTLTAVYESSEGVLVAACVCDSELVLTAGAALCLVPAAEAQQNLKAKKWDPSLVENFKEVLNVCTQLFLGPQSSRVKLQGVFVGAEPRPEKAATLLAKPRWRINLQLSIAGYGEGRIAILE